MSNIESNGSPMVGLSALKDLNISLIISDVDDTITSNGKLKPNALEAMYKASEKGYRIILLSGGSAGSIFKTVADLYGCSRKWCCDDL